MYSPRKTTDCLLFLYLSFHRFVTIALVNDRELSRLFWERMQSSIPSTRHDMLILISFETLLFLYSIAIINTTVERKILRAAQVY